MASGCQGSLKRKRKAKAFGFHSFPGSESFVTMFSGPFRDNVRAFLRECGEEEDYSVEGMPIWCTLLVDEKSSVAIPLYVTEETVMHSSDPYCDHCRFVGWSHHLVSRRRYHMIIPADDNWDKPLDSNIFHLQNHLLHGLIHCNGFGHLLCINGHEGGSRYFCGADLMNLWDRICMTLRTRKVTVNDRSKKSSMVLRLLYATAYGQPWFGRWGYKFCHGIFGVTSDMYMNAVQILGSLPLDSIMNDFGKVGKKIEIVRILECYQEMSKTQVKTLRDLLQSMLESKARLRHGTEKSAELLKPCSTVATHRPITNKRNSHLQFSKMATSLGSRWPVRRLVYTAQVIVDALKEKKNASCDDNARMTRQEVRDAARLHIGDTGLIDFVIKSLGDCAVGNQLVIRAMNPSTRVGEYTVKDLLGRDVAEVGATIGREEIHRDLVYLYKHVLKNYPRGTPLSETVKQATRAILNSKHYAKEWPFEDDDDELLRYWVVPVVGEEEGWQWVAPPPPEMVVVPLHATVGELKEAGEWALRDSYCSLERFEVRWIEGVHVDDDDVVFGELESGSHVRLRGSRTDTCGMMYEGGSEYTWRVECTCGARDDDGERMVACDMCDVWLHTRCEGIDDSDVVPPLFLCGRCGSSLQQSSDQSLLTTV